jgi:hypothetical protein
MGVIATLQNAAQDPIPAACVAVGGLKLLGFSLGVSFVLSLLFFCFANR